jgi:hypothetical protein
VTAVIKYRALLITSDWSEMRKTQKLTSLLVNREQLGLEHSEQLGILPYL